jgi:hypothetical protein
VPLFQLGEDDRAVTVQDAGRTLEDPLFMALDIALHEGDPALARQQFIERAQRNHVAVLVWRVIRLQAGQGVDGAPAVHRDPQHPGARMGGRRHRMHRYVAAPARDGPQPLTVSRVRLHGVDAPLAPDPDGHQVGVDAAVGADVHADLGRLDHVPDQPEENVAVDAHLQRAQADAQARIDPVRHPFEPIHVWRHSCPFRIPAGRCRNHRCASPGPGPPAGAAFAPRGWGG